MTQVQIKKNNLLFPLPRQRGGVRGWGSHHDYTQEEDTLRQEFLESLGLRVLRFSDAEVLNSMGFWRLLRVTWRRVDPSANPLPARREGAKILRCCLIGAIANCLLPMPYTGSQCN